MRCRDYMIAVRQREEFPVRKVILTRSIGPLLKAHINSFTRKDGTFVKEHDDGRQASAPKDSNRPKVDYAKAVDRLKSAGAGKGNAGREPMRVGNIINYVDAAGHYQKITSGDTEGIPHFHEDDLDNHITDMKARHAEHGSKDPNTMYMTNPFRAESNAKELMEKLAKDHGAKHTKNGDTHSASFSNGIHVQHKSANRFLVHYKAPNGSSDVVTLSRSGVEKFVADHASSEKPLTKAILVKSHVKGYTRKDGTFVKEHDDKRQGSAANGNHHPEAVKKTIANLDPDDWEHKDGKSTYGKYIKWGGANHDSAGESLLGNGFELDHDASSDTHEIFRHPEGHVANIKRDQGFKSAKFSIEHGGKASGSAKLSDGAGKVHAIAKQFGGSSAGEEDHYFYKDAAEHMKNNDHDRLKAHLKHGNDEQRETVLKHVHPDHHGKLNDAPDQKQDDNGPVKNPYRDNTGGWKDGSEHSNIPDEARKSKAALGRHKDKMFENMMNHAKKLAEKYGVHHESAAFTNKLAENKRDRDMNNLHADHYRAAEKAHKNYGKKS